MEESLQPVVAEVEAYSLVHLFQMVVEVGHLVVQVVDPEVVDLILQEVWVIHPLQLQLKVLMVVFHHLDQVLIKVLVVAEVQLQ